MLGDLSKKYESNGNPGCISSGLGDAGGKSYGMYQMSSRMGVVDDYIQWLYNNNYWFAGNLAENSVGTAGFDSAWRWLARSANAEDFEKSQHDYIRDAYYKPAKWQIYSNNDTKRMGTFAGFYRICLFGRKRNRSLLIS